MPTKAKAERMLILCVDRDGDINTKAEEKTPILGRKENLHAATALALKDPEEADANAMFEALRVYDQLVKQGQSNEHYQIATISGSQLLGVEADRKLVSELSHVLDSFPANSVILVTDGYSDEAVLPLVESRVPVTSVRRILIRQSSSIEETAALFGKYLRMLTENPRYSRVVLGVPGLLLIILAIMVLGGWLYYTWVAFLIVVGVVFFTRGFGVDKAVIRFFNWVKEYEPPPLPVQIAGFAMAGGIIAVAAGAFLGINAATPYYSPPVNFEDLLVKLPGLVGRFAKDAVSLIVMGACVVLSGRAIRWYFERDIRLLRTVVIIVVVAWSSQIFGEVSEILISPEIGEAGWTKLAFTIVIGILLAIAASLMSLVINRRHGTFFKRRKKKLEEFEQG
ncbi:MAG: DUF373 family protein [Candidatus Bathyarchaeota archaeon]|jgi:putative membrane protein|nr:DUF373 family protein [Candidatus Bathyarchaeota archaeon]